ncbi:MAG TPA: hypothetical protein VMF90_01665 [Rhizobiaceae bacterium]|nr:hypothetical protein [Rhizobiaceae bacterium]
MAEDRTARPVSGEIMAGLDMPLRERPQVEDVIDVEFETVGRDHVRAPEIDVPERVSIGTAGRATAGFDVLTGHREPPRTGTAKGGPAFWIFGLTVAAGAFWISGGHALVRQADAGRAPADRTFTIGDVSSRVERAGARIVLFVDGAAVNAGSAPAMMPPLEIRVTAGNGDVTRYKLGTSPTEIAPGARFSFSSRLEAPTDGVKSVQVDFRDEEA